MIERAVWYLVAAIGLCSTAGFANKLLADDMLDCMSRGRAAATMVMGVASGVPLDRVNVVFQIGNKVLVDEEYMNGIREEIRPLLGIVPEVGTPEAEQYAESIGAKVAQKCAYDEGAKRRGKFKRTASSEELKTTDAKCVELLVDEKIISIHAQAGTSQRLMVEKATRDTGVDDVRWAKIMNLIRAAHEYDGGAGAWFADLWARCKGEK